MHSDAIISLLTGTNKTRFTVEAYDTVTSTNALLRQACVNGAKQGHTIIAGRQTAGRGRLGRSFYSPADTGLYLSTLLPLTDAPQLLTPMAAVAASDAIARACGVSTHIKWVNDLYVDGRKVCGILTEGVGGFAVLGIGINIFPPSGGFEGVPIAGAVLKEYRPGMRESLAAALLECVAERFEALQGSAKSFIGAYRERSNVIGKEITVLSGERAEPAFALDIDDDCRLLVRYADGREESLFAGEISIRLSE